MRLPEYHASCFHENPACGNQSPLGRSHLYFCIKAKSHFANFSSPRVKDDKEEKENTEGTMTFTQKITCNRAKIVDDFHNCLF